MPVGTVSQERRAQGSPPCGRCLSAEPGANSPSCPPVPFSRLPSFFISLKSRHVVKKTNHTVTCFTFDGTLSRLLPPWCRAPASGRSCVLAQLTTKRASHSRVFPALCLLRNLQREGAPCRLRSRSHGKRMPNALKTFFAVFNSFLFAFSASIHDSQFIQVTFFWRSFSGAHALS